MGGFLKRINGIKSDFWWTSRVHGKMENGLEISG